MAAAFARRRQRAGSSHCSRIEIDTAALSVLEGLHSVAPGLCDNHRLVPCRVAMSQRPVLIAEPRWIDLERVRPGSLPGAVAPWLRDPGSLTQAVVRACAADFRVAVQHQGWGRALPSERHLLGQPLARRCLLREVKLLCGDRPWVFARTLIPATSLSGAARRLARLRNRPLGALLFADRRTRRLATQVARLDSRHALYHAACSHLRAAARPPVIWGRRTLFRYAGKPLLVNEIFLPEIPARGA
ncbi:MAG: chorismate lyase [Gammaproteobacteria bacterium]|nr:MAG: chorismate lyase [Gammaproteobacteria bacterium]